MENDTERRWRLKPKTLHTILDAGCIKPGDFKDATIPIYYLAEGGRAKIKQVLLDGEKIAH